MHFKISIYFIFLGILFSCNRQHHVHSDVINSIVIGMNRNDVEKIIADENKSDNKYSLYGNNFTEMKVSYKISKCKFVIRYTDGFPAPYFLDEKGGFIHGHPIDQKVSEITFSCE